MLGNPGKKNKKITIKRRIVTNTLGDAVSSWVNLASVWADERPLRMDERFQSDAKYSVRVSNFRIYYRADVTPDMQIIHDGLTWRITGIAEIGYREEMELTCEVFYGT